MLNPKDNRLDYGSILSPPNNYELDFAIGTTYSLDLDSLVGASISLGLSAENDSVLNKNPIFLLEALRSTGDKIALFCESGQIKLPNKTTELYILLEDMVFQVTNENVIKSKYASFHPKIWLIRYINDKNEVLYRFVVLSRNLTFDRSWDISFAMDGHKITKSTSKNNPLIKLIEYLMHYSKDENKVNKMAEITKELENIDFELKSRIFEGFEFIVNGIDNDFAIQNQQLFYSNSLENILIMSPFLSKEVIGNFNKRKNPKSKATLITQSMSLGNLKGCKFNNFDIFTLKDEIVDGESLLSEESLKKQDIHAKMYVVEKTKYTDLYLGSLNASHNALNGNVEFMIKLWAKKRRFNINNVLKDIFNGDMDGPDNPFQLIDMSKVTDDHDKGSNLNLVVKSIVRLNANAKTIQNGNKYDVEIRFEKDCGKYDIEIKPLLAEKTKKFSRELTFENLDKTELSEFFVITVSKNDDEIKRVIKIPIDNLPDDRQKDVVSKIIKDKTAFIRYVAFLLGDDYILSFTEEGDDDGTGPAGFTIQLPELYEKMLKAAMYNPEKFKEIEFLIKTLSNDNAIPEGFDELYETFKGVIGDE